MLFPSSLPTPYLQVDAFLVNKSLAAIWGLLHPKSSRDLTLWLKFDKTEALHHRPGMSEVNPEVS